jgi:hypothetical protein
VVRISSTAHDISYETISRGRPHSDQILCHNKDFSRAGDAYSFHPGGTLVFLPSD